MEGWMKREAHIGGLESCNGRRHPPRGAGFGMETRHRGCPPRVYTRGSTKERTPLKAGCRGFRMRKPQRFTHGGQLLHFRNCCCFGVPLLLVQYICSHLLILGCPITSCMVSRAMNSDNHAGVFHRHPALRGAFLCRATGVNPWGNHRSNVSAPNPAPRGGWRLYGAAEESSFCAVELPCSAAMRSQLFMRVAFLGTPIPAA